MTIPNSVTTIGEQAFYNCSGLSSVTIGSGVTSIGKNAFANCSGLTSVVYNATNCTTVNYSHYYDAIFYVCSNLTVTIGGSVISIPAHTFEYSGITSTIYNGTIAQWCGISFGDWYSNPASISRSLIIGGEEITNLVIPDSVTSIGDYAFYNCDSLTSVTIGNGVTSIGEFAFGYCRNLDSIICKSVYPPTAYGNTFALVPDTCSLTVPCGSSAFYSATAPWSTKFHIISEDCPPEYTVAVVSADPTMGTVSGGGQVLEGDEITIRAIANTGYRFVRWNDNDTNAVRTVTITSDSTFTAYFEAVPTEGIDDASAEQAVKVYADEGRLYINAAQPVEATVYDMMGRRVATLAAGTSTSMPTGVYLVKVGTLPARKVVMLR